MLRIIVNPPGKPYVTANSAIACKSLHLRFVPPGYLGYAQNAVGRGQRLPRGKLGETGSSINMAASRVKNDAPFMDCCDHEHGSSSRSGHVKFGEAYSKTLRPPSGRPSCRLFRRRHEPPWTFRYDTA